MDFLSSSSDWMDFGNLPFDLDSASYGEVGHYEPWEAATFGCNDDFTGAAHPCTHKAQLDQLERSVRYFHAQGDADGIM